MLRKKLFFLLIFIPYFCFCLEEQFPYLGVSDIDLDCEYLHRYLTEEEKTDWYCAQTQDKLKQAFLTIFYKLKEFVRKEIMRVEAFKKNTIAKKVVTEELILLKHAFVDLELLANEIVAENSDFDNKISEALHEIQELKQTALAGKIIEFPKFISLHGHVPPKSVKEQWNNAITTKELQQAFYTITFSIYMAKKMGFVEDYLFFEQMRELDRFRSSTTIRHQKAEELYLKMCRMMQRINNRLLKKRLKALQISDPEYS